MRLKYCCLSRVSMLFTFISISRISGFTTPRLAPSIFSLSTDVTRGRISSFTSLSLRDFSRFT